jgi:hypothetical protein
VSEGASDFEAERAKARTLNNAGLVACLLGAMLMIWGRFATGAPAAAIWVGVGVIAFGWSLFAIAVFRRAAWLRSHPASPKD